MISFRAPVPEDIPTIESWILADPDHAGKMPRDFFHLESGFSLVIEDEHGPALFVRLDPELPISVRMHIQFGDNEVRTAKALLRAFPTVSLKVREAGISRMVFDSDSKRLVAFCKRCFGFQQVPGTNDYELIF